ncbi:MAG: glycerophosphoryl diester phosphodiesterase [Parcubacteria group bacterium Gr01-1014_20]|nr:MAG: glycerophosphoryl diester phosphodiesterase [Parcubacteria group bacterium Gr01-1014_20]
MGTDGLCAAGDCVKISRRMKPKIIAHRGDSEKCPENTLLAFKKAIEVGADKIELDVHLSADKKLVVHHDAYLGRTDDGEGLLLKKDSVYLKSLDAGKWKGEGFKGLRMPFLHEVFQEFGREIEYEVEMKGFGEEFLDLLLAEVDRFNLIDKIEFTSFHQYLIRELKVKRPEVMTGMFVLDYPGWMGADLGNMITESELVLGKIDVAHSSLGILTEEFMERLRARGILIHPRNCNSEMDIKRAINLRVDQFSTNDPELAIKIRGR